MPRNDRERPPLTPEDIDHSHLPDQTMYKIQMESEQSEGVRAYPLTIRTNEFRLLYFELEPSDGIDWHTHTPGFDEVNLCLSGRAKYTLEREDGSYQTLEINPMEFVYLPGGARHKIEVVGNEVHRSLSAAKFDTAARLEVLENNSDSDDTMEGTSPPKDVLWVDRKRDEVVEKDENLITT
ncbi:MAG: cupin domain-containing protein [Halobacteriaceae archaeon]